MDRQRAAQRAVAADREEEADPQALEEVSRSPPGPAARARRPGSLPPFSWMSLDHLGVQGQRLVPVPGDEALVAVADAVDRVARRSRGAGS